MHQVSKVRVGLHQERTVNYPTTLDLNFPIGTPPKKNKLSTNRPSTKDDACSFNFIVLCSKVGRIWYLRYQSGDYKCNGNHKGHIPVHSAHISQSIKHLPHDVDTFIKARLHNHISSSVIYQLVLQLYYRTINEVDIYHYCDKLSYTLLKTAFNSTYGTPVEK